MNNTSNVSCSMFDGSAAKRVQINDAVETSMRMDEPVLSDDSGRKVMEADRSESESLKRRIDQITEELEAGRELRLRLLSEFDNYRSVRSKTVRSPMRRENAKCFLRCSM